jgi:hypothetical protein
MFLQRPSFVGVANTCLSSLSLSLFALCLASTFYSLFIVRIQAGGSVVDPDPYVFGPPGSGSVIIVQIRIL